MAASTAIKIIKKLVTRELRKQSNKPKIPKVPAKEARELAEREVGPKGRRLVSIESKDKYGKPIKGSPPITDAKPAKKLVVKPSEKLTGRPAGESVVTKTKKIGPKLNLARQKYKDLGGGKVSPERRAEIKRLMDKGVKPDTKITKSGLDDIEPVRPPLSTDKSGKNVRKYKKVIKKIEKPKPKTIGDKPKPRTDRPVQGPAKIKRLRPAKVKGKDKSRVIKPSAGTSNMGGPAQGVKRAVVKDNTKTNTPTLLEMAGLSEKQIATFKELAKKDSNLAREYAEKIADAKPPKTNRPAKKIIKKNPTPKITKADQIKARRIERKIFKKRREAQIKSIKKRIKDN